MESYGITPGGHLDRRFQAPPNKIATANVAQDHWDCKPRGAAVGGGMLKLEHSFRLRICIDEAQRHVDRMYYQKQPRLDRQIKAL